MENDEKMEKKEDLLDRLNRVLEWIRACDTKASILLAVIGLIMTIFSSEYFFTKYRKDCKWIKHFSLRFVSYNRIYFIVYLKEDFLCITT